MKGISLHVGRGTRRKGLTVFPIWQERAAGRSVSIADDRLVRVSELADPVVGYLQVTVIVTSAVLVLDGDVLIGGQQDRVAIGSTLLTGGSTTVINVRCVEQERWSGGEVHAVGGNRATAFVRGNPDQAEVWRRVQTEKQRATQPLDISGLEPLPGQSGVLLGFGGKPALLELFADDIMLAAAWPRILDSAAREAAGAEDTATYGHRAREFVGLVDGMHLSAGELGGVGRTVEAVNGPLVLRGISDGQRLLHASVINHHVVAA